MLRRARSSRCILVAILVAALLLPGSALAEPPADTGMTAAEFGKRAAAGFAVGFDLLILRPLGFATTAVGAVFFIPAVVLSAAGGSEVREEAFDLFIYIPAEYTFRRPLGDF